MAPVSFVGLLDYSISGQSFPDNWYLPVRAEHPPRPQKGVVRAAADPSRCKGQRTATLGLTAPSESFCKDLSEPLTKSDEGNLFLFLSGTQSAGLLRVLRGEQRENWHGGELLHEDDHSIFNNNFDAAS